MPAGNYVFTPAKSQLAAGQIDWTGTNKWWCMFLASAFGTALSNAETAASVSAIGSHLSNYQYNGAGYVAGGMEILSSGRYISTATNSKVYGGCAAVTIGTFSPGSSSGSDVAELLIYRGAGGTASLSGVPVIRMNLGSAYQGQGASFTLTFSANGVFQIT